MTERGGQEWTLADFRRHVPRIIAERDRAEARVAELEAENGELTAARKRMYDKWMAYFGAARKAEADRDASIAELERERDEWKSGYVDAIRDVGQAMLQQHRAERDRAESALAERDATIQRVRELCAMVGGTAVFVRDVLTALDSPGGSGEDGP